jgi:hypothetical protein
LLQASQIRPSPPTVQPTYSPAAHSALEGLPLKFSNGIKLFGLLPGEALEDLVFQPEVWQPRLLVFQQQLLANTLLLLTSNFVTVIQEEFRTDQGWLLSYIPRDSIVGIQQQLYGRCAELTFQLKRGDQSAEYHLRLMPEAAQAWQVRWLAHGGQWQNLSAGS